MSVHESNDAADMSVHESNDAADTVQSLRADKELGIPESPSPPSQPEQPSENPGAKEDSVSSTPKGSSKEWRSWKLRWWWTLVLLLTEAAIIAAIIYLERRSASENGIASIPWISTAPVSSHFSISSFWKYGLLWTTLPSFIMTLYGIMWGTVVSGTADRQPFIELSRPEETARTAKVTIMLDYRLYPSLYNWIVAFRNSHVLLGFAMLLSLLLSIALVPLAAHLFVTAPSQIGSSILLSFPSEFNASQFTTRTSLQPVIELASAIRVSGGNPPPWMTIEYAFEPFETEDETISGNVTAETSSYSAYLDCQTFSANEASAAYDPSGEEYLSYQANDRGCPISGQYSVKESTPIYAISWYEPCDNSDYGRVGLFAGVYSNASSIKIANFSLVSCIASYWNKTGEITMSVQPDASPEFLSFTPSNATQIYPNSTQTNPLPYVTFGIILHSYTFYDPSDTTYTDMFGLLAYSYARTQNAASPITPDLIKNTTEEVFTTVYAALASSALFQLASSPTQAQGAFSTAVTRLYVVTPVAYTIVGFLLLIFVCNVFLFIYSQKHHSILREETRGLLGNAAVLDQSDVSSFVTDFRQRHSEEHELVAFVEEKYTVADSKCYFQDDPRKIRLKGLELKTS
jgi:hypothetical protein